MDRIRIEIWYSTAEMLQNNYTTCTTISIAYNISNIVSTNVSIKGETHVCIFKLLHIIEGPSNYHFDIFYTYFKST